MIQNERMTYGSVIILALIMLLTSCGKETIPDGVAAVKPFDAKRYAGKWYEIARLDIKQEKGLNNTSAEYTLNDDGTINVVNRGYDAAKKEWEEATGKAKFVDDPTEARLKVSFFGPFYSGYNVIAIDADYQYALIAGESLKYLWLLSRKNTMPENVKKAYVGKAKSIGYATEELIWVEHTGGR